MNWLGDGEYRDEACCMAPADPGDAADAADEPKGFVRACDGLVP